MPSICHLAALTLLLLLGAHFSHAQTTWQSSLVHIDATTDALSYTPDPVSGIQIPDFSRAGYHGGVPIPVVPVRRTISQDGYFV